MLTSMSYHKYMNKVSKTTVISYDNHQNEFPFQVRKFVPPNLHQIQPRATQVWNYDKIGFDPNVSWHNVVCTYKFFLGEIICKVQTGERAPLWCNLLVFARAGGKCFMPPIIFHQANEYSQDIHHNISFDWTFHHTPSGYMDRYWWIKAMNQVSNICGASLVKNQILFFDGHDSHFDEPRPNTNAKKKHPALHT